MSIIELYNAYIIHLYSSIYFYKNTFYTQDEGQGGAAALGLMHVGGVFVVLLMGMSLACIVAFFEHYLEKRKRKPVSVSKRHHRILLQPQFKIAICTFKIET